MRLRRRNPNQFTTDEHSTADRLIDEGWSTCDRTIRRGRIYLYPRIGVSMCDQEALKPVERVFGKKMRAIKTEIACDPEIYGTPYKSVVDAKGHEITPIVERLRPLLTKAWLKKHERTTTRCPPQPPYKRRKQK